MRKQSGNREYRQGRSPSPISIASPASNEKQHVLPSPTESERLSALKRENMALLNDLGIYNSTAAGNAGNLMDTVNTSQQKNAYNMSRQNISQNELDFDDVPINRNKPQPKAKSPITVDTRKGLRDIELEIPLLYAKIIRVY